MTSSLALRLSTAAALLIVGGCGHMGALKPAQGRALPVKPLMASSTPTANNLLTPPAYASPSRVDELMKKSAPRQADPFDLPPPNGQAPDVPVQELDNEMTNTVGPATPQ